jgi:hypothetical protein
MTAEQIRDSLLLVAGVLDTKMGGPSAPLTPLSDRRTIYGKVSRYKLDDYLQLFDFPSPNLSAEKRFTTSVPLQRLFFMNSDFMQQQAERVARRVTPEPDNAARVRKAYELVLGRVPSAEEQKAALTFITTEPLKDYDERKTARDSGKKGEDPKREADTDKAASAEDKRRDDEGVGEGMMAGVVPGATKKEDQEKLLPVTPWGRYIKILMSSSEFLFVN